jgi:2-C-methyl-D-erythritol 4-phosphate cytidylyltransferase
MTYSRQTEWVKTWAIVVAAGSGARFGAEKQFAKLGHETVLERAVRIASAECDGVVAVLPAGTSAPSGVASTVGGATRSASVRAGLACVPADVEIVVVHDAARPLASNELFKRVIDAIAAGADGAVPAVPVVDTLKRVEDDRVVATVARDDLVSVQTPQAFRAAYLRRAHESKSDATDDAALVEDAGGKVVIVAGEPTNLKLTVAGDLDVMRALIESGNA